MATQNFQLLTWSGSKQKRVDSESAALKLGSLSIGALAEISEVGGKLDFGAVVLTNLGTPVASSDAATKSYVDSAVSSSGSNSLEDAKSYTDSAISALVGAAPSTLNTLKEIADAIANDASIAATLTGQIGAVSSAVSAEETRATTAEGLLDGRLDVLEGSGAGSVAKALVDAKAYTDSETSRAQSAESALDGRLDVIEGAGAGSIAKAQSDAQSYADSAVAVEKSRAESAESALDGRLDTIEGSGAGSIAKAQSDAQSYADSAVAVEKGRAESAESALDGRLDVLEGSGAGSVAKALVDAKAYTDAETSRAQSAESALDGRLDVIEGSGAGSVAKALVDAKAYADGIEAALDSRLDVIEGSGAGSVAKALVDAKAYADGIETALDSRLDVLEGSGAGSVAKALVDAKAYTDAEQSRAVAAESALQTSISNLDFATKTADEAITAKQVCYIKANGKLAVADADVDMCEFAVVIAQESIANAASGKVVVREGAIVGGFSGLTPGKKCYVSRTAGEVVQALTGFQSGSSVYCVGRAVSATEIAFSPMFEFEY